MTPRFEIYSLYCCVVCAFLCANGEYNDGTDIAERCIEGRQKIWGGRQRYMVTGSDCEPDCTAHPEDEHIEFERGFSWSDCDGCGDTDGGDRYQMYLMVPWEEYMLDAWVAWRIKAEHIISGWPPSEVRNGLRLGQVLFNQLGYHSPGVADRIRGTQQDPFFSKSEPEISRFMNKVDALWPVWHE